MLIIKIRQVKHTQLVITSKKRAGRVCYFRLGYHVLCKLQGQLCLNSTITKLKIITSCFYDRTRIFAAEGLSGCTWSLEAFRIGPSEPEAPARRAARRPWRPLRLRRRVCRGIARRRNRDSPWCTCPAGYTRLPRGRTSRKLGAGSRAKFDKSGCPLSGRSSPQRLVAAFRSSFSSFPSN